MARLQNQNRAPPKATIKQSIIMIFKLYFTKQLN